MTTRAPRLLACALAGALGATLACHTTELQTDLWADSAGAITDPELASLCEDAWEMRLARDPIWAGELGDVRYLGEVPEESFAVRGRRARATSELVKRAEAIPTTRLDDSELLTLHLLHEEWSIQLAIHELGIELPSWNLEPRSGVHVDFLSLAPDQPVATPQEQEQMRLRWSRMPRAIGQRIADLQRGLTRGRVASKTAVELVVAQLDELLATPVEDSPLSHPGRRVGDETARNEPADDIEMDLQVRTMTLVRNDIYPAFRRYRDFLVQKVLPQARDDDHPGVLWVEGGDAYYDLAIRKYTSLDTNAQEIHRYGTEEVARIRAEMSALGERVFGTSDLAEIQERLRTDPALHFETRAGVQERAEECLRRAQEALPSAFGLWPEAACQVVPVPDHEAPYQTIGYYNAPSADGTRPGRYYINTWAPETRPRYDAQVLAWHEAIPGHHLQIAIAQQLEGLPLVRRYAQATAYVEGWALYTERLCDELDLYDGDIDRLGMLSFDAWRACRLVVDTGLHAFGWTRQQAIDYMVENTLLARNNVRNEVDRYIAWPGQALAYKLGQREILALRAEAELELGDRFHLPDFHDRVLENGAVTLTALREHITRWTRAESRRP